MHHIHLTLAECTALRALATAALIVAVLLALPGCGGGDWPEDERATIGPVNCQATPEVCK